MFEHLGAGNLGAVIRRHRLLILICVILSLCLGYTAGITRAWYLTNADHKDVYEKSAVLSLAQAGELEQADEQISFYLDLMKTKDCQNYVAEQIRDNHIPLWLGESINLKHMTSKFPVYTDKMKFTTAIQRVGSSPAFSLTTQAYYQKLSRDILQYYLDYVNGKAQDKQLGLSPLTVVSQNEKIIGPNFDDQTYVLDRFGRYNVHALSFSSLAGKMAGLFVCVTCLLILFLCAVVAHLHPTANCRQELEQDGIPVIGEIGRLGRIRKG